MSVWQTPQAASRTSTSPCLGSARSRSWTARGEANSSRTAARMRIGRDPNARDQDTMLTTVQIAIWARQSPAMTIAATAMPPRARRASPNVATAGGRRARGPRPRVGGRSTPRGRAGPRRRSSRGSGAGRGPARGRGGGATRGRGRWRGWTWLPPVVRGGATFPPKRRERIVTGTGLRLSASTVACRRRRWDDRLMPRSPVWPWTLALATVALGPPALVLDALAGSHGDGWWVSAAYAVCVL